MIGQEAMDELFGLCKRKHWRLGMTLAPLRKVEDIKPKSEAAVLILIVAEDRTFSDILFSDTVENLEVSAKFLTEEIKALG